ncbi:MAG: FecR family protein [Bdellovibrionota bacterium]
MPIWFALLFLCWPSHAAGLVPEQNVRAERQSGDIELFRGSEEEPVMPHTSLIKGDILRTGKDSTLRLMTGSAVVDLAPGTTLQITDTGAPSRPEVLKLLYGHIRAQVSKDVERKLKLKILTPTTSLGVRGTEFLVHVTRNEKEFTARNRGEFSEPPSLKELPKIAGKSSLYSRVCCLDGSVEVHPVKGLTATIHPGEISEIHGPNGDGAKAATLEEIRKTRKAVGLPED